MKKVLNFLFQFFKICCFCFFVLVITISVLFSASLMNIKKREIENITSPLSSIIVDENDNVIEIVNEKEDDQIQYEELPRHLINALVATEDNNFYVHKGVDIKAIIRSLVNNILTSSRQGGSTLTQQLVKNLMLNNEISFKRKIQEAYLAYQLEKNYTKEEIIELYFNRIYFDATRPGIKYAAKRFFNKEVSSLNLIECALLIGLVKSPSLYSPFNYVEKANERKNVVLKLMYDKQYISLKEYEFASNTHIQKLLIEKGSTFKEKNYNYQAYLDIVYQEVKRLTSYSIFQEPLKVEIYLDTTLQTYLDDISKEKVIDFDDNNLEIASVVIDNKTHALKGVIGGRNYNGMLLYNHAYDMLRGPASTIKPLLSYALGMEYLELHEYSILKDEPYVYKNSNQEVHNADKKYLGNITLTEALGYSKNTTSLYLLEDVINKIGVKKVISYLKDINMMDEGEFSYSYGLGGMTYGINLLSLGGAYSMLANEGDYHEVSLIKRITSIKDNKVIYEHQNIAKQVLSKDTAFLITSTLKNIRKSNFLNIDYAFPNDIECVGKTGTGAYDKTLISNYNYPINADKDVFFAGYSPTYTICSWAGFDIPKINEKTYFTYNDKRRKIPKILFKNIITYLTSKKETFANSSSLLEVNVVVTEYGIFHINSFVPTKYIKKVHVKEDNFDDLPLLEFNEINDVKTLEMQDEIFISLPEIINDVYEEFYQEKGYLIKYLNEKNEIEEKFIAHNEFFIPFNKNNYYIEICETYKDNYSLHSSLFILST